MHHKRRYAILMGVTGLFSLLLTGHFLLNYFGNTSVTLVAGTADLKQPPSNLSEALRKGDFSEARHFLAQLDTRQSPKDLIKNVTGLLDSYDKLVASLEQTRIKAYQEHYDKLQTKVKRARWREALLATSLKYKLEDKAKSNQEKQWRQEIQNNWLAALAQLVACHNLAERMHLTDKVEPALREEVIAQCLKISDELEAQDKGLEAYSKVFALLSSLDPGKYRYDDIYDKLVREMTLQSLYAPDPNENGVKWQERRRDINYDILYTAMATASVGYVVEPDFQQMAEKGVKYCLMLTQTKKIDHSFPQLDDKAKVTLFQNSMKSLLDQIRGIKQQEFGFAIMVRVLDGIIKINEQSLKFPQNVILAEFGEGAFDALDKYTYIVWPADVADFRKEMTNQFSGIGVVINKNDDDILRVDSLVSEDAPAFQAGLEAGDLILAVDGKDTKNVTLEKAVHMITGPTGTKVVLTIQRKGVKGTRDYTVTRRRVVVPTVVGLYRHKDGSWDWFADPNNGVAYIRLTHFADNTPSDLRNRLRSLKKQGMKALILDLRGNSGGYLSGAVDVVDTFVSEGRIVSTRYRDPTHEDVKKAYRKTTLDEKLPLVVLINSASASASEIVAGSLQDHHRADIVGTRSFGKGNVQTIQDLRPSEAQLKMTIAYYYLPNGRRVHRDPKNKTSKNYGVAPDVFVELTGKQIEDFLKTEHDASVLHRNDLPVTWKVFQRSEVLASDPQLEMAVLRLKGVIIAESAGSKLDKAVALQETGSSF